MQRKNVTYVLHGIVLKSKWHLHSMSLVLDFPLEICRKPHPNKQKILSAGTQHAMEFMKLKNTLEQPPTNGKPNHANQQKRSETIYCIPYKISTIIHIHIQVPHVQRFFCQTSPPQTKMWFPTFTTQKIPRFFSRSWVHWAPNLAGCVRCFVSCDEHCESPRPWHLGGNRCWLYIPIILVVEV